MIVTYVDKRLGSGRDSWVTDEFEFGGSMPDPTTVLIVESTGKELAYIIQNFDVPIVRKNTMRWYGDMAKFIVGNARE